MIRCMVLLYMSLGPQLGNELSFAATQICYYLGHRRVIEGVNVGSSSTFVHIASVGSCLYTAVFVHQNVEFERRS